MRQVPTNPLTNKKMGKRTYTLKELAQRNVEPTNTPKLNEAPRLNLVNIQEDLLDEGKTVAMDAKTSPALHDQKKNPKTQIDPSQVGGLSDSLAGSIDLITQWITKEVALTSAQLDLDQEELQAWIELQVMAPKQTLLALLRLARANGLDPLKEEVALALYDDTHWQAYITVEGYSKILNCHPAFDGIAFSESTENTNGIPIWMECTIYRKDRSCPTIVREYFEEVKSDQAIWQKMPRRMLRHRVMAQCARLAVG